MGSGPVTAKRTSRGIYEVRFKGIGIPNTIFHLGNTQIVAVGTDPVRCKSTYTVSDGAATDPSMLLGVACHDAAGALADSKFVAMYASVDSTPGGEGAYGWFGADCSSGEIPNYNSMGSYITCTRDGTGTYTVRAGALGPNAASGNVQVTAQGSSSSADRCRVGSFGRDGSELKFVVRCHSAGGSNADEAFFFNYSRGHATSPFGYGAYAFASNESSTEYVPSALWTSTPMGTLAGKFSTVGRYWMQFPLPGHPMFRVPFVVAAIPQSASSSKYCKVEQWLTLPDIGMVEVQTRCFDGNHQPANATYLLHMPNHVMP